jgi:hypothetical protein
VEAVGGAEDVVAVLQKGKQHRSTFATNMNEHSSRSHLVLTIYVKGYDTAKGKLPTVLINAASCCKVCSACLHIRLTAGSDGTAAKQLC